eukprot:1876837-Prymnesium_polylepis.1
MHCVRGGSKGISGGFLLLFAGVATLGSILAGVARGRVGAFANTADADGSDDWEGWGLRSSVSSAEMGKTHVALQGGLVTAHRSLHPARCRSDTAHRASSTMATTEAEVSMTAVVKWFDRKKGFGFATPEGGSSEGGDDIFVHQRNIVADGKSPVLDEGDTIYYTLGEHNGRPTAMNIKLPVGHEPSFEKRRRRGRNAKKEMDAEADKEQAD